MGRRVYPGVEALESRDTPSGTPLAGGAFLPPGLDRAYGTGVYVPPPVQLTRDGPAAFLPPGLYPDHNNEPPPVQAGAGGSVVFLPPGAAHGPGRG
jgi:hypothetical protein